MTPSSGARTEGVKVVCAFDSFKGSLSAREACDIASRSLLTFMPETSVVQMPVADGGEGTVDVILTALNGELVTVDACGPIPDTSVRASFGWCASQRLAVIEMAAASGLTLIRDEQRNPMITTTRGTGQLMEHAIGLGAERILLCVGGSATVDGGTGAARALGWRFLDNAGHPVPDGGKHLGDIETLIPPARETMPRVDVLCDVTNPMTGPNGAALIFGPQKGATTADAETLDRALRRLTGLIREQLGVDIETVPGAGAAGGLAGGAIAWWGARLFPGIDHVLDVLRFDDACRDADWIITGEGSFDAQSLHGKVVSGVIRRAHSTAPSIKIAVLAGQIGMPDALIREAGIDYVDAITPQGMPIDKAMASAPELLETAIARLVSRIAG